MNLKQGWRGEYKVETSASPDVIWSIFRDVGGWKAWNSDIEHIDIDGPFLAGTWFTMKPCGQDPVRLKLIEVRENQCFVDEARIGDLTITVTHRIECLETGRTHVVYVIEVSGSDASEIGPAIASDFPEVLTELAKLAEARSA